MKITNAEKLEVDKFSVKCYNIRQIQKRGEFIYE